MLTTKRIWSLRRIFLLSIIGSISLLAIASIAILSQPQTNNYNMLAANDIKYWANILTDESRDYLVTSERQALSNNFSVIADRLSLRL